MKIVVVYQTSRGTFISENEANLKKNRQKDTDPYSQSFREYEKVLKLPALLDEVSGVYFKLEKLDIYENHNSIQKT